MDYRDFWNETPEILQNFLSYHETIRGHSKLTADEYFLDLRTFMRFMKLEKGLVPRDTPLNEISILDVGPELLGSVTVTDVYSFINYLSRDHNLGAAARVRKIVTIRTFYKYLANKVHILKENPMEGLDSPKLRKTLPRYLTLEQSIQLLESVDEPNQARDYCILTLFLNCGLRISELAGLNVSSVQGDSLRVLGKGNKERTVFLNEACQQAISDWLEVRALSPGHDEKALFLSRKNSRLTTDGIHYMVKQRLKKAGLDASIYSSHKLRHTSATLMLQNGVDVRTIQEVLGHENLNTTQIYTHIENTNLRDAAQANPLGKIHSNSKKETPK